MDNAAVIAAIEAAIAGNPSGITEYEIHGRKVSRMSLTELLKLRDELAAKELRASRGSMFAGARPRRPQ